MDAAFQRRKAQELVLLKLSLAIGDINHAKEATRITPAKVALGSVNNLLPVIRVGPSLQSVLVDGWLM